MLGILQRYIMGEVLRSFTLALPTITAVPLLFMVMLEATKTGLTPAEILHLVPFVIPGSLPYTIPVSLLLAVTVVYGRLSSDNELVAMKTAGLSAFSALRPALILGILFHLGTGVLLQIGAFPLYMICLYLPLAPWERWVGRKAAQADDRRGTRTQTYEIAESLA